MMLTSDMSVPMTKGDSKVKRQLGLDSGVRGAGCGPSLSSELHAPGDRPSKRIGHPVQSSSPSLRGPSSDSSHVTASPVEHR